MDVFSCRSATFGKKNFFSETLQEHCEAFKLSYIIYLICIKLRRQKMIQFLTYDQIFYRQMFLPTKFLVDKYLLPTYIIYGQEFLTEETAKYLIAAKYLYQ